MITVQETTVWDGDFPNHKYILSDNASVAYGYIKLGDKYPTLFSKPLKMDWARRKYVVLLRTKDFDPNTRVWKIQGSKGHIHMVTLEDGVYKCSCPAALYRGGYCKHIQSVEE